MGIVEGQGGSWKLRIVYWINYILDTHWITCTEARCVVENE